MTKILLLILLLVVEYAWMKKFTVQTKVMERQKNTHPSQLKNLPKSSPGKLAETRENEFINNFYQYVLDSEEAERFEKRRKNRRNI